MGLTRIRAEQISDIDYKQAVRVIALTDISLSGGAPNQVDEVNLTANDRVLVTGNDPASENGLYIVQTVGAGSNGTWVRSSDGNSAGEIEAGMIVMVTEGTVYKDTQWKLTTNNPIVIGTTPLNFVINILSQIGGSNTQIQFNDSGTMGGSSNLTWDGSSLYANGAVSVTGNATVGNLSTIGTIFATGDITGGAVSATGNVLVGNVIIANNGANGITLYQSNGTTKATNTTGVILALGDSWIGGGYIANSTTVWANVASRAFQATVVNQAVGGRLSTDVLANLTTDVAAAGGYNNINCAVINVGGNDKLQSPAANIAQYNTVLYNNLTSILNVLTGNGVPVILSPAPDIDLDDFYATGIAPDYAAPIDTGQYVDDPQYAVIANNYQGVTVATNSMSYLFNHPAEFLIPGGFHPTLTQGQQCFVDIIASAGQGLNQNSLNAAMTMSFDLIGFNQGIELGTTTLESTPFIDFHSSGNSTVDYDSRIIGSGGNGAAGTGNINFFTNNANVSGNILSSGLITATGNITASYFLGNGSQLTGIATSYGNANVVANLAALASNPINTTGNITGGNLDTGIINANSSITGRGSLTIGNITTGNTFWSIQDQSGTLVQEYGRTDGVASTPTFDFHSGATAVDYDVRMQATGGTGVIGQGTLSITGANFNTTGNANIGTNGGSGSNTTITIGSAASGAVSVTQLQGGSLGTAANSVANIATMYTGVSNGSFLRYYAWRQSNTTADWTTAATRIQQRIDVTDQGYIQFNGVGLNYGIELGTGPITNSEKFIRCYQNGNVALYFNDVVKLATATDGITVTGNINNGQSNGVGNIGSATTYFDTVFAKATSAQYADLAEIYAPDQEIAPGTVVCFGGQKEVCKSHSYAQSSIAGVVSTNPAYVMNSRATGVAVALTGRVPCQVVGTINKGDLLVSSDIPGVATKLQPGDWVPGCVIGKALENYNSTQVGTIEVVAGRV